MPTALIPEPQTSQLGPPRKHWTRGECSFLETAGLLDGQHLELIEGDLINKMGKNWPHVSATTLLRNWLLRVFGDSFVVTEASIDVAPEDNPTSEPEPDIIVLNRELGNIPSTGRPRPEDLRLVVEVSDTALLFDLSVKANLYARAEIVEYWVLDVTGRRLIVHRDPQGGKYASVLAFADHEATAPLAAPAAQIRAAEVLLS